jgi:hypothetical protein
MPQRGIYRVGSRRASDVDILGRLLAPKVMCVMWLTVFAGVNVPTVVTKGHWSHVTKQTVESIPIFAQQCHGDRSTARLAHLYPSANTVL